MPREYADELQDKLAFSIVLDALPWILDSCDSDGSYFEEVEQHVDTLDHADEKVVVFIVKELLYLPSDEPIVANNLTSHHEVEVKHDRHGHAEPLDLPVGRLDHH